MTSATIGMTVGGYTLRTWVDHAGYVAHSVLNASGDLMATRCDLAAAQALLAHANDPENNARPAPLWAWQTMTYRVQISYDTGRPSKTIEAYGVFIVRTDEPPRPLTRDPGPVFKGITPPEIGVFADVAATGSAIAKYLGFPIQVVTGADGHLMVRDRAAKLQKGERAAHFAQ